MRHFFVIISKFPHALSFSVIYIRRTNRNSLCIVSRRPKTPKYINSSLSVYHRYRIDRISRLVAASVVDPSSDRRRTERNFVDEQFKRLCWSILAEFLSVTIAD